ncbi:MAG: hypothetical protein ACW98Y_19445 [Candidatus Thorarchaeota archaeon]|jgi:hypothetical protein
MTDKENPLKDSSYSWKESNGVVRIYWYGKLATILRKNSASKFLARIDEVDNSEAQFIMAKITGNFKRGNERTHTAN